MARPKIPKSYKRRAPSREPYDYVLIVCEGSKSEPHYLRGLCVDYQLSSANIRITPGSGTDPLSIVVFAEEEAAKATAAKAPYDRVYCVFDRDSHDPENYAAAIARATTNGFITIISFPCFEIWVLLHYSDSDSPFVASGGRSPCDNVIRKIRETMPEYAKGNQDLYKTLRPHMNDAITRAKRLETRNERNGSPNPATQFHHLVEYLQKIKS